MAKSERLLTIKEFAAIKRYSERSIRQKCKDGSIKAQKLADGGRKWLIPESELNKFVAEAKPTSAEKPANRSYIRTLLQLSQNA